MEPHPSNPHSRHRFAAVMAKLHLHKASKALLKPPSLTSNVCLLTDDHHNSNKELQGSSPPIKTRPVVHSNSQTMRNYALQRSTKVPLRVPAAFPANLNFSQQTFCLFDAPRDHEDEGDFSCFLDDLLNGPPPPNHTNDPQVHDHTRTTRHHMQSLSGKLSKIHTHLRARRGSSTSPVLPTLPAAPIPDKALNLSSLSSSKSPDLNSQGNRHVTKEQYFDEMDEEFKALFYCKPRAATCQKQADRKPLAHIQPMSPRYCSSNRRTAQVMRKITEDFEEEKEAERLRLRRSVSSPDASKLSTLAMTPFATCPRIDFHLESSPFFNPSSPTFGDWSQRTPGTSQGGFHATTPDSGSQALTPSTSEGLGTPTASPLAARLPIICNKFSMATGSPGIVNSNEHTALAPHSLPLSPLGDYRICLQSPPSLPVSLNQRSLITSTQLRGPGADMFATLEFLSDLCQRSQACAEEKDSVADGTCTTD